MKHVYINLSRPFLGLERFCQNEGVESLCAYRIITVLCLYASYGDSMGLCTASLCRLCLNASPKATQHAKKRRHRSFFKLLSSTSGCQAFRSACLKHNMDLEACGKMRENLRFQPLPTTQDRSSWNGIVASRRNCRIAAGAALLLVCGSEP